MADDGLSEFQADSGASLSYPVQCSSLRKNGFVVVKGFPCKVVDMSTSKTGKHGHAKVHLVAIDIFTGKKYEEICPSTHNMDVPNVKRSDYTVLDISEDGYLSLLTADGGTKDDLKFPEDENGQLIRKLFDEGKDVVVSVVSAMGTEGVVAVKEGAAAK
jgi:translation initiation factor 5A